MPIKDLREFTASKSALDPTDIHADHIQAQISIIANNPHVADPFRDIFENDPLHLKFLASGKQAIRIGVYRSDNGLRYYDYDSRDGEEFNTVEELLDHTGIDSHLKRSSSKRIYIHGHGNGAGDGIVGDHVDSVGSPFNTDKPALRSEKITNADIVHISRAIVNPGDKAHFAFLACDYANAEQASRRDKTTNAFRFNEELANLRKSGVKTTVSAATTSMFLVPIGKTLKTSTQKTQWKSPSARRIIYNEGERSFEIIKPPLSSTSTAILRKKNILNFISGDYMAELLEDHGIPKEEFIDSIQNNPNIIDFQSLETFLQSNTQYSVIYQSLTALTAQHHKQQYKNIEEKCAAIDESRFYERLMMISQKPKEAINNNDAAYVALANGLDITESILEKNETSITELNATYKNNGALYKAFQVFDQYDIAGINGERTQSKILSDLGETPLTLAIKLHSSEARTKALQRRPDPTFINERDSAGNTPLMIAAQRGDVDSVRELLTNRLDINLSNPDGETALMLAENIACFEAILAYKPDLTITDNEGNSVLNRIVQLDQKEHLNVLLSHPQETTIFNQPNKKGITPLMFAAESGDHKLVEQLLARGADPRITTTNGKTTAINFVPQTDECKVIKDLLTIHANRLNQRADPLPSLPVKTAPKAITPEDKKPASGLPSVVEVASEGAFKQEQQKDSLEDQLADLRELLATHTKPASVEPGKEKQNEGTPLPPLTNPRKKPGS